MSDRTLAGAHPTLLVRVARQWDSFGLPVLFLLLVAIFSVLSPSFRTGYSLLSNLSFSSLVAIGSIGMVFCIMSGDMDISVGSMAALSGVLGASLVKSIGGPGGALVTIAVATALGFVNGVFVTKLRIPAFITTLGMQFVYRALAYIYTGNRPVYITDTFWLSVASGNLLGIPIPVILMAVCFGAAVYVLKKTPFGRYVVAVGTNRNAAMLSGINVDRIKNTVFTLVGFFVGIATIVNGSFLGSINPGMTGHGVRVPGHHRRRAGRHAAHRGKWQHARGAVRCPVPDLPAERPGPEAGQLLLAVRGHRLCPDLRRGHQQSKVRHSGAAGHLKGGTRERRWVCGPRASVLDRSASSKEEWE